MLDTIIVQIGKRGVMTLPKSLRELYNLHAGDQVTLLDLGGVIVLSPRPSQIDKLANQLKEALATQGETLETMLLALREEREKYDLPT